MTTGVVYFIRAGSEGPIKIGFTGGKPSARLAALQTGNHETLVLIAVVPAPPTLEGELHRRFDHLRGVGEWFSPGPDLLALIDGIRLVDENRAARLAEENEDHALGLTEIEFAHLVELVAKECLRRREFIDEELAEPLDVDDRKDVH